MIITNDLALIKAIYLRQGVPDIWLYLDFFMPEY
jgi:hypothetical protein